MAKLIYSAIASLDGYVADQSGNFDWAAPDEEVHAFVNDLERPAGTYLYGRRMYETMVYWETARTLAGQPPVERDFAEIWQAADKIVYSRTLETVSTARTRLERDFDPEAVRRMKARAERDLTVGGPDLAAQAIKAGLVDELSRFMGHFNSKLAREVGRLTGWKQKIFGRRYQAIVVSSEEAAQIERLRYGLAHGCKEDLVERPRDWPGVHAVRALVEGEALEGLWFDRTQEYAARHRGEDFSRLQYATREILTLDPLPCWKDLTEEQRQRRAAVLVEGIEAEAAVRRKKNGVKPPGPATILTQDPHRQPARSKKSPAPAFHAASQAVRRGLREAYSLFVAAYREAAEKLRAGNRNARFPLGSFPPALPFVGG